MDNIVRLKTNPFKNIKRPVIALSGGIASGKTMVANEFKKLGAFIIDSDKLSRTLTKKGSELLRKLSTQYGREILTKSKTLNRKKLGCIIFRDKQKRKILERIMHPAILSQAAKMICSAAPNRLVIFDAPLLFETGLDRYVNMIIVVSVPESIQIKRLKKRDGLNNSEISIRLASQMPLSIKKKKADYVIDNSKQASLTNKQVHRIWRLLTKDFK